MLTKLFIFGLLCSTVIQAFPTDNESQESNDSHESNNESNETNNEEEDPCPYPNAIQTPSETPSKSPSKKPVNTKVPCVDQVLWLQNTTLKTKSMYDEYYQQLAANKIDVKNMSDIKSQHDQIDQVVAESIKKYQGDLNKVNSMKADAKEQWDICIKDLKGFSLLNSNLSAMTQSLRPKVIEFAKRLGLSPEQIDDLDHTLGRVVNFMFIIDMGKNTLRDLHSMVKEADFKSFFGIKLEKKYKFTEKGVEATGKLEEAEVIGNIKEPAHDHVVKPIDEPHEPGKDVYNTDEWDKPNANDKEFEDLIDLNDPNINEAEQGLEQRERVQAERLAEEQRLAEQERREQIEREEQEARLKQERELEEREIFLGRPTAIHVGKK